MCNEKQFEILVIALNVYLAAYYCSMDGLHVS